MPISFRTQIFSDTHRLVVKKIQKEDRGMYQCFVSNEWEQIQSTAELQLGGKWSMIVFFSKNRFNYENL